MPSKIKSERVSRPGRIIAAATVMAFFLTFSTFAASLADYKKRIELARMSTDELFRLLDESDTAFEREKIAEIEKSIPATEKIEWPGGSVESDNSWLRARLKDFAEEPDNTKRGAILTEISERLVAISEAAGELEMAAAGQRSKDEDKQKLAEILRREEYQKPPPKEPSLFEKWLGEFLEWVASILPRPAISPETASAFGSLQFGLQILIYALVIGLIGFLMFKFAPFVFQRFGGKTKKETQDRVILGERIAGGESAAGLFSEAERLAREGNLRSAIRKGYIALLCDLSDRKMLCLALHKTNRDYLRDVRRDRDLFENMAGLTLNFENNWYGLRTTEQADWDDFRTRYLNTIRM